MRGIAGPLARAGARKASSEAMAVAAAVPSRRRRDRFMSDKTLSLWLREQRLNGGFGLGVIAFAEVGIDDLALLVDQVDGRPVLVVVGGPGCVAVVLRHRVADI